MGLLLWGESMLRPPLLPTMLLLRPPVEGRADLSSTRILYILVLVGGGLGDLAESPLDDLVAVCGGSGQVVEVCVKVFG